MPQSEMTLLAALEGWHMEHEEILLADGIGSSFHRRKPTAKRAATIRFDCVRRLADLTVWASGECIYSLADARSGGVKHRSVKIVSPEDLNSTLRVVMSWLVGGPKRFERGVDAQRTPT
jgi:hypothetical protein